MGMQNDFSTKQNQQNSYMLSSKWSLPLSERHLVGKGAVGDWKDHASSEGVTLTQLQLMVNV